MWKHSMRQGRGPCLVAPSLVNKCEVLGDKINERMRQLSGNVQNAQTAVDRKRFQAEMEAYLLDVTCLLKDNSVEEESEPTTDCPQAYPSFVKVGDRSRSRIIKNYKIKVERSRSPEPSPSTSISEQNTCSYCNSTSIALNQREAVMVCLNCAATHPYISECGNLSWNEEKQVVPEAAYMYQRINHLKELLAQIQAKQCTDIPEEVIDKVKKELMKRRITHTDDVDMAMVNKILRSLKLIKYYEHSNYICYLITGRAPIRMAPALENKLCSMFHEIQVPWEMYKSPDRHNFLSYHYVLYQMCKLLNADDFLPCFTLLKSADKLEKTNQVWEKICKRLRWQFISADNF